MSKPHAFPAHRPTAPRFESCAYLSPMGGARIRKQVEYLLGQGWHAAIEHTAPEHARGRYWTLWKLPLFGIADVDTILAEAEACRQAHPAHHVRLVGYDNRKQTLGISLPVYRGRATP